MKTSAGRRWFQGGSIAVLCSMVATTAPGCSNCPDRELLATAAPVSLNRGTSSSLLIAFPEPVFVEESPARERDMRVELSNPAGTEIAAWRGSEPLVFDQVLTGVAVVDQRAVRLDVTLPANSAPGIYKVSVLADSAGSCEGPHATVAVEFQ